MHDDVVGARIQVLLHALGDHMLIPPGQQRVDQPVAAVAGQVLVPVAEPPDRLLSMLTEGLSTP